MNLNTIIAAVSTLAVTTLLSFGQTTPDGTESAALITAFSTELPKADFEWGDYSKLVGLRLYTTTNLATDFASWDVVDDFALDSKGFTNFVEKTDADRRFFRLVAVRDPNLPDGGNDIVVDGGDGNWYIKVGTDKDGKGIYIKTDKDGVVVGPLTFWRDSPSGPEPVWPEFSTNGVVTGWSDRPHKCPPVGADVIGSNPWYILVDDNDGNPVYVKTDEDGKPLVPSTYWTNITENAIEHIQVWPKFDDDGDSVSWDGTKHTCPPPGATIYGKGPAWYILVDDNSGKPVYIKADESGKPLVPSTYWTNIADNATAIQVWPELDNNGDFVNWNGSKHICPPSADIISNNPATGPWYLVVGTNNATDVIYIETDRNGTPLQPASFWKNVAGTRVPMYPQYTGTLLTGWSDAPHTCPPFQLVGTAPGPYYIYIGTNSAGDHIYIEVGGDGSIIEPPTLWTNVPGPGSGQYWPKGDCTCENGCPCCGNNGGGTVTPPPGLTADGIAANGFLEVKRQVIGDKTYSLIVSMRSYGANLNSPVTVEAFLYNYWLNGDCPQAIKDAAVGVANAGFASDSISSPDTSLTPMPFTLSKSEATAWGGRINEQQYWWVRSGSIGHYDYVAPSGVVTFGGIANCSVRPAFWIELNLAREKAAVPVNPLEIVGSGYTVVKTTVVDSQHYALIVKTSNYDSNVNVTLGYVPDKLAEFLASTDNSYPQVIRDATVGVNDGLWGYDVTSTPRPDASAEVFVLSVVEASAWVGRANNQYWWLRSASLRDDYVAPSGVITFSAATMASWCSVRPAMWVAYQP